MQALGHLRQALDPNWFPSSSFLQFGDHVADERGREPLIMTGLCNLRIGERFFQSRRGRDADSEPRGGREPLRRAQGESGARDPRRRDEGAGVAAAPDGGLDARRGQGALDGRCGNAAGTRARALRARPKNRAPLLPSHALRARRIRPGGGARRARASRAPRAGLLGGVLGAALRRGRAPRARARPRAAALRARARDARRRLRARAAAGAAARRARARAPAARGACGAGGGVARPRRSIAQQQRPSPPSCRTRFAWYRGWMPSAARRRKRHHQSRSRPCARCA